MDSEPTTESKKRTLSFMKAQDLAPKLRSKQNFLHYLDK